MRRSLPMLCSALLVTGCTGSIKLSPLDPTTLGNPTVVNDINSSEGQQALAKGYNGLLVYLPKQVLEVDQFTQVQTLAADNKTIILSGDCDKSNAYVQKVVTVVDRKHPYLLQYSHGLLETYTFAATLTSDGALASINTSSTPDQGKTLANLTSAAASAGGLTKLLETPGPKPICTQTPTFIRYDPLP